MILAIDTSTALTGVACYQPTGVLAEAVWQSGRNHTAQLLPQITLLLQHVGRTPADLTAIAVALGPGSWSGLRVGMSVAKGLAFAGGLALIGINTLDVLAVQQLVSLPVYPLIRLGRERFATALFLAGTQLQRHGDYRNVTLSELCAEVDGRALFCGDLDAEARSLLQRGLGEQATFATPAANLRRPAYLAELAWQRLEQGQQDDIARLEPIYLGAAVKPGRGISAEK